MAEAVSTYHPPDAEIMLIEDQSKEQDDTSLLASRAPADRLLDQALLRAGMGREKIYLTKTIKRCKTRNFNSETLHDSPTSGRVQVCYPWLAAEIRLIQPLVIVCLGTALTRLLLRRHVTPKKLRSTPVIGPHGGRVFSTYTPAAILRMPEGRERALIFESFVQTLAIAKASTVHIRLSYE